MLVAFLCLNLPIHRKKRFYDITEFIMGRTGKFRGRSVTLSHRPTYPHTRFRRFFSVGYIHRQLDRKFPFGPFIRTFGPLLNFSRWNPTAAHGRILRRFHHLFFFHTRKRLIASNRTIRNDRSLYIDQPYRRYSIIFSGCFACKKFFLTISALFKKGRQYFSTRITMHTSEEIVYTKIGHQYGKKRS